MTKLENKTSERAGKVGNAITMPYQKLILSHLNIQDSEASSDTIDDYDC